MPFNCPLKFFSLLSVVTISRCNSRYSFEFLSTWFASNFACVSFNAFKRSSVSFTLSFNRFCFCCHKVILVGLNLRPLFTCLNSLSMLLTEESTCFNACSSGAVSPRNSIVIPLIFPAILSPIQRRRLYRSASPSVSCFSLLPLSVLCFSRYTRSQSRQPGRLSFPEYRQVLVLVRFLRG